MAADIKDASKEEHFINKAMKISFRDSFLEQVDIVNSLVEGRTVFGLQFRHLPTVRDSGLVDDF